MIRILESKQVGRLFARRAARLGEAEAVVRPILEAVRKRRDRALLEYARRFDGLEGKSVRVPPMQLPMAQLRMVAPGLRLGQIVRPLDSVAAYIPGGRYPLPSTVMMTVIPAQVAGVKTISVASPSRHPVLLGA